MFKFDFVSVREEYGIDLCQKLGFETSVKQEDPTFLLDKEEWRTVQSDANNKNAVKDGSLVMGNLMNAAYALGLGSCWINRASELFDMPEGKQLLKKWGIEGEYVGIGNCILGYPDQDHPQMKPRKENYVYYVR